MSKPSKPRVPEGLRDMMKDLTREILKEKPIDLYNFAENYFHTRLPEKENYAVKKFEKSSGKYDFSYIENTQHYQIPVAFVYTIIPEGLTNLIKDLIKAVLREQPQNLCDFAVEYFRHIKAATTTESKILSKEINYSAYENYFINKERFLFTPYVKCTCGRTLGEVYANNYQLEDLKSIHKIHSNDSAFQSKHLVSDDKNNNNVKKFSENDSDYSEKYINSIYIIQTYFRRYLKRKNATTKRNKMPQNLHSIEHDAKSVETVICKQYETPTQAIPLVPQLQLTQNDTENNSEDASYTSASTALLSATETGCGKLELSTGDSILTKTIIEGVGMENDEKNISKDLKEFGNDHADDETTINGNKEIEDVNKGLHAKDEDSEEPRIKETENVGKEIHAQDESEELIKNNIDSKSEEFDSTNIDETNEKYLAKTALESKEHVVTDNIIESCKDVESFANEHVEKVNNNELQHVIKPDSANFDESPDIQIISTKIDKDVSDHDLYATNKAIQKESNFNLATESKNYKIEVLVYETHDSHDEKLNDDEAIKNNDISLKKFPVHSRENETDSVEKITIIDNATINTISKGEQDQIQYIQLDTNNENNTSKDKISQNEIYVNDKSTNELIKQLDETANKSEIDIDKGNQNVSQRELIEKVEGQEKDDNGEFETAMIKQLDNATNKSDLNTEDASQIQFYEKNSNQKDTDSDFKLKTYFQKHTNIAKDTMDKNKLNKNLSRTSVNLKSESEISESKNNSNKIEFHAELEPKISVANDSIDKIADLNRKEEAKNPLLKTNKGELDNNIPLMSQQHLFQKLNSPDNLIEKHSDLKLNEESKIMNPNNNDEKKNILPDRLENEIFNAVKTTNSYIEIDNVNESVKSQYQFIGSDEVNDTFITTPNLNKRNTQNLFEKEVDTLYEKKAGEVVQTSIQQEADKNLNEISDEIQNKFESNSINECDVKKLETEKHDKNLEISCKNELNEITNKADKLIEPNENLKLIKETTDESKVDLNVINDITIDKSSDDTISINLEEIAQLDYINNIVNLKSDNEWEKKPVEITTKEDGNSKPEDLKITSQDTIEKHMDSNVEMESNETNNIVAKKTNENNHELDEKGNKIGSNKNHSNNEVIDKAIQENNLQENISSLLNITNEYSTTANNSKPENKDELKEKKIETNKFIVNKSSNMIADTFQAKSDEENGSVSADFNLGKESKNNDENDVAVEKIEENTSSIDQTLDQTSENDEQSKVIIEHINKKEPFQLENVKNTTEGSNLESGLIENKKDKTKESAEKTNKSTKTHVCQLQNNKNCKEDQPENVIEPINKNEIDIHKKEADQIEILENVQYIKHYSDLKTENITEESRNEPEQIEDNNIKTEFNNETLDEEINNSINSHDSDLQNEIFSKKQQAETVVESINKNVTDKHHTDADQVEVLENVESNKNGRDLKTENISEDSHVESKQTQGNENKSEGTSEQINKKEQYESVVEPINKNEINIHQKEADQIGALENVECNKNHIDAKTENISEEYLAESVQTQDNEKKTEGASKEINNKELPEAVIELINKNEIYIHQKEEDPIVVLENVESIKNYRDLKNKHEGQHAESGKTQDNENKSEGSSEVLENIESNKNLSDFKTENIPEESLVESGQTEDNKMKSRFSNETLDEEINDSVKPYDNDFQTEKVVKKEPINKNEIDIHQKESDQIDITESVESIKKHSDLKTENKLEESHVESGQTEDNENKIGCKKEHSEAITEPINKNQIDITESVESIKKHRDLKTENKLEQSHVQSGHTEDNGQTEDNENKTEESSEDLLNEKIDRKKHHEAVTEHINKNEIDIHQREAVQIEVLKNIESSKNHIDLKTENISEESRQEFLQSLDNENKTEDTPEEIMKKEQSKTFVEPINENKIDTHKKGTDPIEILENVQSVKHYSDLKIENILEETHAETGQTEDNENKTEVPEESSEKVIDKETKIAKKINAFDMKNEKIFEKSVLQVKSIEINDITFETTVTKEEDMNITKTLQPKSIKKTDNNHEIYAEKESQKILELKLNSIKMSDEAIVTDGRCEVDTELNNNKDDDAIINRKSKSNELRENKEDSTNEHLDDLISKNIDVKQKLEKSQIESDDTNQETSKDLVYRNKKSISLQKEITQIKLIANNNETSEISDEVINQNTEKVTDDINSNTNNISDKDMEIIITGDLNDKKINESIVREHNNKNLKPSKLYKNENNIDTADSLFKCVNITKECAIIDAVNDVISTQGANDVEEFIIKNYVQETQTGEHKVVSSTSSNVDIIYIEGKEPIETGENTKTEVTQEILNDTEENSLYADSKKQDTKKSIKREDKISKESNKSDDSDDLFHLESKNRLKRDIEIPRTNSSENDYSNSETNSLSLIKAKTEISKDKIQDKKLSKTNNTHDKFHIEQIYTISHSNEEINESSFENQLEKSKDGKLSIDVEIQDNILNASQIKSQTQTNDDINQDYYDFASPNAVDKKQQLTSDFDLNSSTKQKNEIMAISKVEIEQKNDKNNSEDTVFAVDLNNAAELISKDINEGTTSYEESDHVSKQPIDSTNKIFSDPIKNQLDEFQKCETDQELNLDETQIRNYQTQKEPQDGFKGRSAVANDDKSLTTHSAFNDTNIKTEVVESQGNLIQEANLNAFHTEEITESMNSPIQVEMQNVRKSEITTDEDINKTLNSNNVSKEIEQVEKYPDGNEMDKLKNNLFETYIDLKITSKNFNEDNTQTSSSINMNQKENIYKSAPDTKNPSDEIKSENYGIKHDQKNTLHFTNASNEVTILQNNIVAQTTLGSNNSKISNQNDKHHSESFIAKPDNKDDFKKIPEISSEDVFEDNLLSKESKQIPQLGSIDNETNLNVSNTVTNILGTTSKEEDIPRIFQIKTLEISSRSHDNKKSKDDQDDEKAKTENIILSSEAKHPDYKSDIESLNSYNLLTSEPHVQELNFGLKNKNDSITLSDGETNSSELCAKNQFHSNDTDNQPNKSTNNPNEKENIDEPITKLKKDTDISTYEMQKKLNSQNIDNATDPAFLKREGDKSEILLDERNINKDDLSLSDKIIRVDLKSKIENSKYTKDVKDDSINKKISEKPIYFASEKQATLGDGDENLTSNELELECSVKETEAQDILNKNYPQHIVPEKSEILNNSKDEISKENTSKEAHLNEKKNGHPEENIKSVSEHKPTLIPKDDTNNLLKDTSSESVESSSKATVVNNTNQKNVGQPATTEVKGVHINDQETTHNIGIQTSETFIGNQNLKIGRIRNFNESLLGSISGQRFAETHLRSFWKEYLMNNSTPLSYYDYRENEQNESTITESSQQHVTNNVNKTKLPDQSNKYEKQIHGNVEPEIIKKSIKQSESSPVKEQNISHATKDSIQLKDIERIPRYFYGVPDTASNDNANNVKRKHYKEPTAFTIPIDYSNKKHTTKTVSHVKKKCIREDVSTHDYKKNNITKLNLASCVDVEPLLDAETPTKLFQDLNEFEYEIHDVDLDITYTIDEIIRLKIENDSRNNSDENDENINDVSDYSATPEPMLQTIVELSESETPKPIDLIDDDFLANLEKISNTTSTSWTTGSKEDNSFVSDEFLDDRHNSEYTKESSTNHPAEGGIYEFANEKAVNHEVQTQNEQLEKLAQAPSPPNYDPFCGDEKETAAKKIQGFYRQYIKKNMEKPAENISKSEKSNEIDENSKLISNNTKKDNNQVLEKSGGFEDTANQQNIENNEHLILHDEINKTQCNELEYELNIEKIILDKEINEIDKKLIKEFDNLSNQNESNSNEFSLNVKDNNHPLETSSDSESTANQKNIANDECLVLQDEINKTQCNELENLPNIEETIFDKKTNEMDKTLIKESDNLSNQNESKFNEFIWNVRNNNQPLKIRGDSEGTANQQNNTQYNELKNQANIEATSLYKELNEIDKQFIKESTNSENLSNQNESNTKEFILNVTKRFLLEEEKNSNFSIGNSTIKYINYHISESKQPIVNEDHKVITLQRGLSSDITSNKEDIINSNISDSKSKIRTSSNSENQKLENSNILLDNCDFQKSIESQVLDGIETKDKCSENVQNFKEVIKSKIEEAIIVVQKEDAKNSLSHEAQNGLINQTIPKSNNGISDYEKEILKSNHNYKTSKVYHNNEETSKKTAIKNYKSVTDISKSNNNFEPTAPTEENIQSTVSLENIQENHNLLDQAARKIQNAFRKFIKRKPNLKETKESSKSNWFVGDEPIVANDSLTKTASEISFEETEAYIELTKNPSQYLVDTSSNLETIDANNFSRTPTAPVSNHSRNSVDLAKDQSTIMFKDTVSAIVTVTTGDGKSESINPKENILNKKNSSDDKLEEPSVPNHIEKLASYSNFINKFINSERHHSEAVNHYNPLADSFNESKFLSPDISEISKILSDLVDAQKRQCSMFIIPYERLEEPCIKESISHSRTIDKSVEKDGKVANTDNSSSSDIDDTEDSFSTKTIKLYKPEMAITRMQERRDSTTKVSNLEKAKDYNFDEPFVAPIDNLDTDEEEIVVNKIQREETRESSAQSDFDVIIIGGNSDKDDNFNFLDSINIDKTFPAKGSLKRVHTIAADGEAKSLLKNVTIDESIKYIEPPDYELNSGSLCLDNDTTENIRRKMMAYSLSEADSDCFDKVANNADSSNSEPKSKKYDDFNISTALVENGGSSTETESTIVSAITKIQAGARGYLTRKHLGKTSIASDGKSMTHDDIFKASFGNAAISESLEYLVQEAAAKRIQRVYRQHYRQKLAEAKRKYGESISPEFATSLENTLAQKRSIMLQRGDALRNDSTPDEDNSSSNGSGSDNIKLHAKIDEKVTRGSEESNIVENQPLKGNDDDPNILNIKSAAKTTATIRAKKIEENKMRWLAMRQNSMPVQIESEVLRVIPKYMRKKIKSAEGEKKKHRRLLPMD